jgi:hypothetical protein
MIDAKAAAQWFIRETGVSANTAKKMTRFYQLLSEADCSENYRFMKTAHSENQHPVTGAEESGALKTSIHQTERPFQCNIHIHIPQDASPAQIDLILSGVAKHLKCSA